MGQIPLEHGLIVATILLHSVLRCNGATQPIIYVNEP